MTSVPARKTVTAKGRRTLSQRLMQALAGEVRALEKAIATLATGEDGSQGEGGSQGGAGAIGLGTKARVDAIAALTRTLGKLMELTRLEAAAAREGLQEDREAERLRGELMKRLRAIDARRGSGRRLFENAAAAGIA